MMLLFLILGVHISLIWAEADLKGSSVFRICPGTEFQLGVVEDLANDDDLDFWARPGGLNKSADVLVPAAKRDAVERLLSDSNIKKIVLIEDVDEEVKKEASSINSEIRLRSSSANAPFFSNYHSLDEIYDFLNSLVRSNPSLAQIVEIGTSGDNRKMKLIKIKGKSSTPAPAIWIDAGIHAREWVSIPTALYIAERLVKDYSTDAKVRKLVDTFDWYILPVINPDGYEFSRTPGNRLWRKTRSTHKAGWSTCKGVDLNRNFGFKWGGLGTSNNPCQDIFRGPSAFSERESQVVSNYILKLKGQLKAYLSFHAYGNLWMSPWGYTDDVPSDFNDLMEKADVARKAIASVHGTRFTIGSSTRTLYAAAGGSDDWAKAAADVKYAYTVELRDDGHGFILPKEKIIPTGQEIWAGVREFALAVSTDKKIM